MGQHNTFGLEGEQIAADYLTKKGYQILERNYRYDRAEIDILVQLGNILAVVEVKSRSLRFLEDISEVINKSKIQRLVKATDHFIREHDLNVEVRFDIIIVIKKQEGFEIEHLEDAFHYF